MNKMRLILTLITIAIVAGPLIGMLLAYQNDFMGLVMPSLPENLETPTFVESQYDEASRTVSMTFSFKNPLDTDLTINSMSANLECEAHNFPLGTAELDNPVKIRAGETKLVTISGTWTEEALDHFQAEHSGETSVDVELVDLSLDLKGMKIQTDQHIPIEDVPLP
jgi:hypothetical protein